jgi:hypothetical protein
MRPRQILFGMSDAAATCKPMLPLLDRALFWAFLALLLTQFSPVYASLGFLQTFLARTHPNCAHAASPHQRQFCATFKASASCYCTSSGLPASMCQDIERIYQRMLLVFDNVQKACEFQQDTSQQICMDSWKCYRLGGKDSKGRWCNGTGLACLKEKNRAAIATR